MKRGIGFGLGATAADPTAARSIRGRGADARWLGGRGDGLGAAAQQGERRGGAREGRGPAPIRKAIL